MGPAGLPGLPGAPGNDGLNGFQGAKGEFPWCPMACIGQFAYKLISDHLNVLVQSCVAINIHID